MYSLLKFRLLSHYARDVILVNQLNFKYRVLKEWAEAFQERSSMRPQYEIAQRNYIKKVWFEFKMGFSQCRESRLVKEAMWARAERFHAINLAGKVFHELSEYAVFNREQRKHMGLA
jgi:hypothetical protein